MIQLPIKPLSVNDAWKGQRFKTDVYKRFEKHVGYLLRPLAIPDGPLELRIIWGFSNRASDNSNPLKPFEDILQKYYGFDDNRVYRHVLDKVITTKGSEFIAFEIRAHQEVAE